MISEHHARGDSARTLARVGKLGDQFVVKARRERVELA